MLSLSFSGEQQRQALPHPESLSKMLTYYLGTPSSLVFHVSLKRSCTDLGDLDSSKHLRKRAAAAEGYFLPEVKNLTGISIKQRTLKPRRSLPGTLQGFR